MSAPASASSRTPEQSAQVFWGLGDHWWKQIIDGSCHNFGPRVFDEGLHGGAVEPGFLASIKKGCLFVCRPEFSFNSFCYVDLHRESCAHFNKEETMTLIGQNKIGQFAGERRCWVPFSRFLNVSAEDLIADFEMAQILPDAGVEFKSLVNKVVVAVQSINQEIAARSRVLGFEPFAEISCYNPFDKRNKHPLQALVRSPLLKDQKQSAVRRLFCRFRTEIQQAETDEQRLRSIANLFQMLEWLHPFYDGQGRTDIVLLNKLLCDLGFNPAILNNPYYSTHTSLDDWITYLKEGMAKWREVQKNLPAQKMVDE
jgi:hypothetical protein